MHSSGKPNRIPINIDVGKYKDLEAVVLESEALRVTILPNPGAKIASLINKKTGHECMFQVPNERFRKVAYGATYPSGDYSGFDEMFPTIDPCLCNVEPWEGTKIPDHGEVWALPWKCEVHGSEMRTSVHGVRFPYLLTRTISLVRSNTLLLSYKAENLSAFEFPAMWSAHPLFNTTPGTRLILPESARNILNTVAGPVLGEYGGRFIFPHAKTKDGQVRDLSKIGSPEDKRYAKYCFLDTLEEGFAILHDPKTRETVAMVWPVEQVPYLGIWMNEGGWENCYHVAPEPCTAPFDGWDIARKWGKLPVIPPFGSQQWEMRITIDLTKNPRRVDLDGTIR